MDRPVGLQDRGSRRRFLRGALAVTGLGLLSGCGSVAPRALQPRERVRIGLLGPPLDPSPEARALRAALHDLGYEEHRNLTFVPRFGSSREGLATSAAELVDLGVDVIVAADDYAALAARDATRTIPIIIVAGEEPVGAGLVASLARPGGNVTGLASLTASLRAKRLEFLKGAVPGLDSVAVVWVSKDPLPDLTALQDAATRLDVQLSLVTAGQASNLRSPFAQAIQGPLGGLLVLSDTYTRLGAVGQLTAFAAEKRLPAIYDARVFAERDGLMAYGPNLPDLFRRSAVFIDRILKGAKPADLPVEQPTTFDLVINLKTAEAIGLTIPESVLQQATEIIQ